MIKICFILYCNIYSNGEKIANNEMNPEEIIIETGGCGRYQIRLSIFIHLIKTIVCFAFSNLIIGTKTPTWYCVDKSVENNLTSRSVFTNASVMNRKEECYSHINKTKCENIVFDSGLNTLSSEFGLICDIDFIPSTINSIQITGVLAGNIISGQLADLFGRKPPFFVSICLIILTHVAGYFAVTWQMFAVCTFFSGFGGSFFLTTQYCILSEFTLAKWRAWVVGFPSWPMEGCLFALIAWLLHDWRYLQLTTAIMAVPCLLSWFIVPESFRWYIAHDKTEKAKIIIGDIAKFNKKHDFNSNTVVLQDSKQDQNRKYTFIYLFKSRNLTKITCLLMLNCLTSIPTPVIAVSLQNRFGRRTTALLSFVIVAAGGLTVGLVQTLDFPKKDTLTNIFAFIANAGISMAWGPVQTMTIELYPTVIRNVGFGTLSLTACTGAILGPQLVYLNSFFRGLLFYVCGGMAVLCIIGTMFLPETKDRSLNDKIKRSDDNSP